LEKDFEFEIKEGDVNRTDRKAQWEKAAGFIVRHGFAVQTHSNGIGQVFKAFSISSMPVIESLSIDEVGYLALCLLPHILQPRTVQGKEGKRDRFSATTALGQLIQFAKAGSSMFAALETLKKEKGVTQPCVLAFTQTGDMGGKLSDLFVIVDAVPIFIPGSNVSVSVETLFASFFAFNLSYPPSLYGVYSLLEMLFNVPQRSNRTRV
uniref:Uncharacterized protein n=1 Tax=Plectus sambesii TaxID=2011161 RepID=A0A914US01_9BILA